MRMTPAEARQFAHDWIAGWNSHDLERILAHYAEDIVFLSPMAEARVGNGRVVGKPALRAYWSRSLQALPQLAFDLEDVLTGHDSLTILYRSNRSGRVAESFEFAPSGAVVRAFACYAERSAA